MSKQNAQGGSVRMARPEIVQSAQAAAAVARRAPLGVKFKVLYGSGALIEGITTAALTYFLLFYLTAVCGLSGVLAGTAMFLGLLIDALIDPLIGLVSDNTRSRLGRRLPYLLFGTVPLAIAFALLFSIPAGVGGMGLMFYATLCSMAVRIGQSIFNLPYVAVGAEVTDDYDERSSIATYRVSFSMLGTFLAIGLGLGVFMAGANGLNDRPSYIPFGWTCAALICLGGFGGAAATRSVLPRLHAAAPVHGSAIRQFVAELRDIFRNRSFVVLFVASLAFFVAQGMAGALAIYINKYFWKLSTSGVQLVLVGATLGPILGVPVYAILSGRMEKRRLTIINFMVFVLGQMWSPLARLAGLLPDSESVITGILFANALLAGSALVGAAIGAQSMMADAVDEHEHLFGVRREGLFFSGLAFAVKAASGLGGFLAGASLDLIRFPTELVSKGGNVQISEEIIRYLGIIAGPVPALITLLAPLTLFAYTLSRKRHAAILLDLEARRHG
jgi:GPH family glycoside/pentoside/hexuronide:cation symporter